MLPQYISVGINKRIHNITSMYNFYRPVVVRDWDAQVTEWSGWYQTEKPVCVENDFYHCSNIILSVRNVFWDSYNWITKKNNQMPSDYPVTYKSKNINKLSQILMNKLALHITMLDWLNGTHLNNIYHCYLWYSIFL